MGDLITDEVSGILNYVPIEEFNRIKNLKISNYEKAIIFSNLCRINTLYMIAKAGSGHIGSSFSSMDILTWLYLFAMKGDINIINEKFNSMYKVVSAPGPNEIKEASNINALAILDNGRALDISQLSSLIKDSSFVVANDTGPAHMTSHLGSKGLALFGAHTTAHKVSIERENFKAIQVSDLSNLSAEKVFERLSSSIS